MAVDIGAQPDTVRKWRKFGRIPQDSWQVVIAAAAAKGHSITLDTFVSLNTPMKQRGRPAHKSGRLRRSRREVTA